MKITKEELLKRGFEKYETNDCTLYSINEGELTLMEEYDEFFFEYQSQLSGGGVRLCATQIKDMEHLKTLYKALRGKELI